jgi:MbtH protein
LAYLRKPKTYMETVSMDKEEDTREYQVLVNTEEQYSLWLAGQAIPNGWRQVGPKGQKQVCLDYVKEVWTDMRPLSVRKAMEKYQAEQAARKAAEAAGAATGAGGAESAETAASGESTVSAEGATSAASAEGEASSENTEVGESAPPQQTTASGDAGATA